MIQGSSPRSRTRLCTTPIAIATPSTTPSPNPSTVALSVTPAWNSRLRGLSRSLSTMLPATAAAYQTTSSTATASPTGHWPSQRAGAGPRTARPAVASVIAVPGAQRLAHPVRHRGERGAVAQVERAPARGQRPVVDQIDDAPGPRAHHDDAVRQEHRLADRVGDEDHRLAGALPQPQQLLVQVVARELRPRPQPLPRPASRTR